MNFVPAAVLVVALVAVVVAAVAGKSLDVLEIIGELMHRCDD